MPTLEEKQAELRAQGVVEGSPEWNAKMEEYSKADDDEVKRKQEYQDKLRADGLTEGSPEWDGKMADYDEDKDPLEGRPLKPSEIGQPTPEHARDQEEVAAMLDETHEKNKGKMRGAKEKEDLDEQQRELTKKIQDRDNLAQKQADIVGLKSRIRDGNTTQAEMAELKVHPEHTSVGSGHGNPAD